jgi:uncharacterized membrane protein
MGVIYLVISILAFGVLGVSYKLSGRLKCNSRQVNLSFFLISLVVMLVWVCASRNLVLVKPAIVLGSAMGLAAVIAVAVFREACAKGKLSTSWTILQLSLVVPALASVLYWHEMPSLRRWMGLGLVLVAIVLLGVDMGRKEE